MILKSYHKWSCARFIQALTQASQKHFDGFVEEVTLFKLKHLSDIVI